MNKRNIVTCILLSIFTCGIYGIVWFISLTDDVRFASHNSARTSGGVAFLLTLVTCGIYGYYWAYIMGKDMVQAGNNHGISISDNSLVYLLLQVFGLGIINYCLIQNDLNSIADRDGNN